MLKKLFRKKNYNTNKVFKLLIINDESTDLSVVLGITTDRRDTLANLCREAIKLEKLSASLNLVYSECKHENEIAYATLLLGRLHERSNTESNSLLRLFEMLSKP
jgi:hypothetical protein